MANPAFVQGTTQATSASTILASFPSNNTAGNLLIMVFRVNAAVTVTSVTDSQGNTWIVSPDGNISTTGETYNFWYAQNCKAGANTVTLVISASDGTTMCIGEYSGVATSGALDGHAAAAGTSSGNITTTTAGDLLIGYGANNTGTVFVAGAGYTIREQQSNVVAFEDNLAGAPGTYSATFSAGPSDTGVMAFKPVPAVTGGGGLGSFGLGVGLGPQGKWEMF
jgi:hypothetical protein